MKWQQGRVPESQKKLLNALEILPRRRSYSRNDLGYVGFPERDLISAGLGVSYAFGVGLIADCMLKINAVLYVNGHVFIFAAADRATLLVEKKISPYILWKFNYQAKSSSRKNYCAIEKHSYLLSIHWSGIRKKRGLDTKTKIQD